MLKVCLITYALFIYGCIPAIAQERPLSDLPLITDVEGSADLVAKDATGAEVYIGEGEFLEEGLVLKTGSESSVGLTYDNGIEVQVSSNTEVRTEENSKAPVLELLRGKVRAYKVKAKDKDAPNQFYLRLPTAVVGVRGTEFVVETDPNGATVHTLEGNVQVGESISDFQGDKPLKLGAGQFTRTVGTFKDWRANRFKLKKFKKEFKTSHPRLVKMKQRASVRRKKYRQQLRDRRQDVQTSRGLKRKALLKKNRMKRKVRRTKSRRQRRRSN